VAIAGDGTVKTWHLDSGERAESVKLSRRLRNLVPSVEARLAAGSTMAGSETSVHVIDAAGVEIAGVRAGLGGTSAMAFSPDGQTLAAGSYDANVRVWKSRSGELVRIIEDLPVSMFAMAFSPDGETLATAGVDRTVYLWDTKTWQLRGKLAGQPEMIRSLAYSRDGRMLITGGFSVVTTRAAVSVLVWDVAKGTIHRKMPAPHAVGSVAFDRGGGFAASASGEKAVRLWAVPPLS
jgi:WD40 repeat protein